MKRITRHIFELLLLLILQIFVLNDIVLKTSISFFQIPVFTPMIYFLFILMLPVGQSPWLSMLIGMAIGLVVDMFSNTPGLHAMVCVLLAFVRPSLLRLLLQQNLNEIADTIPTLFKMGFRSYLIYIVFATSIHHLLYYFLQEWSIKNLHIVLFKTILSGIVSVLLIFLMQLFFSTPHTSRKKI